MSKIKDNNIKFRGAIHSLKIDREGETKVVFEVSLEEIAQMRELSKCLETILEITVRKM